MTGMTQTVLPGVEHATADVCQQRASVAEISGPAWGGRGGPAPGQRAEWGLALAEDEMEYLGGAFHRASTGIRMTLN